MGTNAMQTQEVLEQGVGLFNDLRQRVGSLSSEPNTARAQARLLETQVEGDAHDIRRDATEEAGALRETREKARARSNTDWGGSNLAMSGSKQLVRDAGRTKDLQDEADVLFQGEMDAQAALKTARNRANLLRVNSGLSPDRSTLSLGSKIYQTRS